MGELHKSGNPSEGQSLSWPKYDSGYKQMLAFSSGLKAGEMPEKDGIMFLRDLAFGKVIPERASMVKEERPNAVMATALGRLFL